MELAVRHQTTYRYATPANQVSLLLRLYPSLLDCQQARSWEVTVNGTRLSASGVFLIVSNGMHLTSRMPK